MVNTKNQVHKSGALKQSNKAHKHGKHRSKGAINTEAKGQVSVKKITKGAKKDLNREQRKNQTVQIRQNKRDEILAKKRCLGGLKTPPFLIAIVPLHKQMDLTTAVNILTQCESEAAITKSPTGIIHICVPRFKQRFSFIQPSIDDEFKILDTLKICDTVLFVTSAVAGYEFGAETIDNWGLNVLQISLAQGLPTPVFAVTDLESVAPKKKNERKLSIQKLINKYVPDEKLMVLDKNTDGINLIRRIGNQKQKSVLFRDRRPHMYAEHVEYVPDNEGTNGTLKVTGFLRGKSLSVNNLIHIPGLGDYQMSQIDAPNDPFLLDKKRKNEHEDSDGTIKVLERCDPSQQESLESENIIDPMDAEQTWPTEDDERIAEEERKKKPAKKIPKGWSDYQAAWIPDDDENSLYQDDSSEEEDSQYIDAMSQSESMYSDAEDQFDTMTEVDVPADKEYDKALDEEVEKKEYEKIMAAKSHLEFPDEVDTPQETNARERFQKYRYLESFRTSHWDPLENLPIDYGRLFRFQNYNKSKKSILNKAKNDDESVRAGWYITIHVQNVPRLLWAAFEQSNNAPVVIGLFKNEHKMSILNLVLKRTTNYNEPIKSKERLLFQCGYRRFFTNPIFSQHTNGDRHKFERYFQPNTTIVASFYGPIQFPPAPVLCYKEINNKLVLVATGSLLSSNPDRLIIKRTILSGHPFKVHKHSAVIRFMFFNREDIQYFQQCKLRTKYGSTGAIKEPLGTHGHMKCIFDKQLKPHDTVLLNLYKRVFPKWTYEECIVGSVNTDNMEF